LRATRFDALIVVATALAAVLISVEFCILIGVFLCFVLYVPRAAQVQLTELTLHRQGHLCERTPDNSPRGSILLFDLEGEISFGAATDLQRHLTHIEKHIEPDTRVVVLLLKRARNPDAVFLGLLAKFHRRLQQQHVVLTLAGVRPELAKSLRGTRLDAQIGPNCIIPETPGADICMHDVLRCVAVHDDTSRCDSEANNNGQSSATETAVTCP